MDPAPLCTCVVAAAEAPGFWGWFFDRVLPGVIIALIASLVAPVAIERYRARRDHLSKTTDVLREQLHKLQTAAADYWSVAYAPKKSAAHEEQLLYLVADIGNLFRLVAPDLVGTLDQKGTVALALLNDAVTGGEFRSKRRTVDLPRVAMCRQAILGLGKLVATQRRALLRKRVIF